MAAQFCSLLSVVFINETVLQNRRPCLRFNFLVNRSTMCLSERPCCGHISNDSPVLDPWLINSPDARSWFQHCTSASILKLLSWHSVVWWMTCTVLRTARCIGVSHSVSVLRKSSKAEKTLDESTDCCNECVIRACQTPTTQIEEGSQVGKHKVFHARLAKRYWSNQIGKSAGTH